MLAQALAFLEDTSKGKGGVETGIHLKVGTKSQKERMEWERECISLWKTSLRVASSMPSVLEGVFSNLKIN